MQPDERNAIRSYLQRCEVRLSTLHRIATAFIGGAGLLLLFPVFFKDVIATIIDVLLHHAENQYTWLGAEGGTALTIVLFAVLAYPLALSLIIPLYGVYLLLKDIVHFYFTLYAPGFDNSVVNPTFALGGILFSPDESPTAKKEVMRYEYTADNMKYAMPFSLERRRYYFDTVAENTNGKIRTPSRPATLYNDFADQIDEESFRHFNTALGITRSMERDLIKEVAVTEMALVRHIMYLRRLVLRYMKTLLMFIWTTIISFLMLPFVKDDRLPTFLILGIGYVVWSWAVLRIIQMPISWIYRHRDHKIEWDQVDPQLTLMERDVWRYCQAARYISLAGFILALLSLV